MRAIHNYVVQNTRYLHVGLGIHGWKPYRTTTCFRNRYGDCKDKAALLKVMLDEAGVGANMVLVRTRRLGSVEERPASMHIFNHAIAYVPSMDLFLDGTAEFNGTHELTPMDQGAQALVIEDGGKSRWVTLPVDAAPDNTLVRTLYVDLTGETPKTTATIEATGANAVYFRSALEDPERRDEVMEKRLASSFPGARVVEATYSNLQDLEKPVTIRVTFEGGEMIRSSDTRRFLYPLGEEKDLLQAYASQSSRSQDLTIRVPFVHTTTIHYMLPPGSTVSEGLLYVNDGEFGSVSVNILPQEGAVVAEVRYSLNVQRVSVEDYPEFRAFLAEVTAVLNKAIEFD